MIPRDATLHMACLWLNLAPEATADVARAERDNPGAYVYLVDRKEQGIDLRIVKPQGAAPIAEAEDPESLI